MNGVEQQPKKIVLIGDGYVGKTSILHSIEKNEFIDHAPNVYDVRILEHKYKNSTVHLEYTDTAGQEEYDFTRQLLYKDADIFLMCFAINDRVSFENLNDKWIADLQSYGHVPKIIVGTKLDLATSSNRVSRHSILDLKKQVGAADYIECSAKESLGIKDLINAIIKILFRNKKSCFLQ